MTETRGERRAETAKQSDDSDLIESAIDESMTTTGQQGSGGGNLQRDVATQAERDGVDDPDARESVKQADHMAHGQHSDEPHPAEQIVTER